MTPPVSLIAAVLPRAALEMIESAPGIKETGIKLAILKRTAMVRPINVLFPIIPPFG
ncbi:MAG: hypothetical protein ACD_61C00056G0003 [uncultured bacterium]|nr:MAG: hypothetical protein ACD_61C00056G0003 [uncultured bacterium]